MDACAACGTRVEDGLTKCPQCGASLSRPGGFLQVMGWVCATVSLIPLAVGIVTMEQGAFAPLGLGLGMILAGVIMIVMGRIHSASSPAPTVPLSLPGVPPASEAQLKGEASHQRNH